MEIVSNIALISINETLVVQLVSFLIFLFIINRIMFRPLRETMRERDRFIDGIHQDITTADQQLKDIIKTLHEQESVARLEAMTVKEDVEAAADKEAALVLATAREDVAALSRQTEENVNTMLTDARKNMETEALQIAGLIMEKLLDRKVTL